MEAQIQSQIPGIDHIVSEYSVVSITQEATHSSPPLTLLSRAT